MEVRLLCALIALTITADKVCDAQLGDIISGRTFDFLPRAIIGRQCESEGREGVCQRRNRCSRPTNFLCGVGIPPIICCVKEPREKQKPVPTPKPKPTTQPQTSLPTPKLTTVSKPKLTTTTAATKQPSTIAITNPPSTIATSPEPTTIPKPVPTTPPRPKPTTAPRPKPTTTKPVTQPENLEDATTVSTSEHPEIVFPGCGYRYPSAPPPPSHARPTQRRRNRRPSGGGLFGGGRLREKRHVYSGSKSTSSELHNSGILLRKKRRIQPVIVGGVEAEANSWPWMVAIFRKNSVRERFLCGASLISKNYVLSAAHCFDGIKNIQSQNFTVKMGSHNTTDGTSYVVENVLIHPKYKSGQYYNDISLLKVNKEVTLTTKSYPVCLPSPSLRQRVKSSKENVTVTGWGDTSFGGRSSKVLHEVELPVVPLKECNNSYYQIAQSTFPQGITNLFICAGLKEGGKDACQGDSGGPLVMELRDTAYVQLGVVSFGYGCAQPGFPGVYTRVSKFAKWIYDNTDLGKT